jgi:hypothetical protein
MSHHEPKFPANRLAGETSPYLLQHAHNPVDWYPWGPESLERSKAEGKPIFLSIGYSACHWCHVMERESFEDPQIAALMNEHFINIKVDREERPDIDSIYMAAVQAMTGHGGWPMSVFLTPEQKPFFGGTYYPPTDRRGMPGFPRVLLSVSKAWGDRRDEIVASAAEMTEQLSAMSAVPSASEGSLDHQLINRGVHALTRVFDATHGGFGSAPKFPHPMDLRVLLRHFARTNDPQSLQMVRLTLDKMARGGIYDHLNGGFARYSTDERWLAPHFEKMLYDNALLITVYLEAYQVTREPEYARVVTETLDYILTRMTDPEGGFYSTEDADSEGVEGKYYVWSSAEIAEILGEERAKTFANVYDVSTHGNWEETNILNQPKTWPQIAALLGKDESELRAEMAECRAALLKVRETRIPPGKDTKILTSWNGLMLAPLAEGARILGQERYLDAARKAAAFLLDKMVESDGRLLHSIRDGRAKLNAYLDDYANLIDGLTRLFEASGESQWIQAAVKLADVMIREFHDASEGSFFYTGENHEALITRTKELYDNATPAANSMAATALLRLGALTGREDLYAMGLAAIESVRVIMEKAPTASGQALIALDFILATPKEFAIVANPNDGELRAVLETLASKFIPNKVVAPGTLGAIPTEVGLLADRPMKDGRVTIYVCEKMTCKAPVVGVAGLLGVLA